METIAPIHRHRLTASLTEILLTDWITAKLDPISIRGRSMAETLREKAKRLIAEARQREKCLELAKAAERRLEDVKDELDHQAGWKVGLLGIVLGAAVSIVFPPVGIGIAIAGATGALVAGQSKLDAIRKAQLALKRAVDDLEECLKK